jgi:hypothetical protein
VSFDPLEDRADTGNEGYEGIRIFGP